MQFLFAMEMQFQKLTADSHIAGDRLRIDPFPKRHRLVHNGGFRSSTHYIVALIWQIQLKFRKILDTRYNLPNYKVSVQFKSYYSI